MYDAVNICHQHNAIFALLLLLSEEEMWLKSIEYVSNACILICQHRLKLSSH